MHLKLVGSGKPSLSEREGGINMVIRYISELLVLAAVIGFVAVVAWPL